MNVRKRGCDISYDEQRLTYTRLERRVRGRVAANRNDILRQREIVGNWSLSRYLAPKPFEPRNATCRIVEIEKVVVVWARLEMGFELRVIVDEVRKLSKSLAPNAHDAGIPLME